METFVTSPENRHDFLPDLDIEITSLEDLFALEIRVEIRHKSNWANESLRLHRRNKFMCELLAAIKRIQIERPGGNWGPDNPSFVSEQTVAQTVEWQREKKERVARTKVYAQADVGEFLTVDGSGKTVSPAQAMFPGLKRRGVKGEEGAAGTGRRPSVWSPM